MFGGDVYYSLLPALLDALNWHGDLTRINDLLPYNKKSMTLTDLQNTLASLNYNSKRLKCSLSSIDSYQLPGVFIVDDSLFVLVKTIGDTQFLVFDATKRVYLALPRTRLPGVFIRFFRFERSKESLSGAINFWFYKLVFRHFSTMLFVAILSLVITLFNLVSPLFVMLIYNQMEVARNFYIVLPMAIGVGIYVLTILFLRLMRSTSLNFLSARMSYAVNSEILRRILYLPLVNTESASLGAQINRIHDFDNVHRFFTGPAATMLFELPFSIVLFVALYFIGGQIVYIPLSIAFVFLLFAFLIIPFVRKTTEVMSDVAKERQEILLEISSKAQQIKDCGAGRIWSERFAEIAQGHALTTVRSSFVSSLISAGANFLTMLAGALCMYVGSLLVIDGKLSSGGLMASMLITWRILAPLKNTFNIATQLGKIKRSIGQVNRLMSLPIESKVDASVTGFHKLSGMISFSDVSLRYPSTPVPILLGINFEVNKGEVLNVKGHSSSGKSTLFKILLNLYSPQNGKVMLNGVSIKQIDPGLWRRSVYYVSDTPRLFYGTIEENIFNGIDRVTSDHLEIILNQFDIKKIIDGLPLGLKTQIHHQNIDQLSELLALKIHLGRMLVISSSIICLDQPERGLAMHESLVLLKMIHRLKKDKTFVIASDDERFIAYADKVLVLDRGRGAFYNSQEKYRKVFGVNNEKQ